jgi:hypothetical protein
MLRLVFTSLTATEPVSDASPGQALLSSRPPSPVIILGITMTPRNEVSNNLIPPKYMCAFVVQNRLSVCSFLSIVLSATNIR